MDVMEKATNEKRREEIAEYIKKDELLKFKADVYDEDGHVLYAVPTGYIVAMPPDDVAPVVHGHFVHDGTRFSGGVDWWHCSSCGGLASGVETRFCYCPFCGAKMDGGDDGETD